MGIFVTGDPHWDHDAIRMHCHRPWNDIDSMNEDMKGRWNSVVSKGDEVYILGDFAFKNHNRWIMNLNGKKHLILGNHDKASLETYKQLIDGESYNYLKNFTNVFITTKMIQVNKKMYFLSHYCNRVWPSGHYGAAHLFGHSHGRLTTFNMSMDVGVDTKLANYAPIPIEVIEQEIAKREEQMEKDGRVVHEGHRKLYRQDDVAFMMRCQELQPIEEEKFIE